MVRPVHSKRKLFTSSKEQKENTTPCCTSGKLPYKSGDAEACQNYLAPDEGTSHEALRKSPCTAGSSCQLLLGRGDTDSASDAAHYTAHCPVNTGVDSDRPTAKADPSAGTVQSCNAFHCAQTTSLSTTTYHAQTVPFSCSPSGSGVGSSPLSGTPGRYPAMPMSERQQIALLMQMSSPTTQNKGCSSSSTSLSPLPRCHSPYSLHSLHFGQECTVTPTAMGGRGGLAKRNERGETPLHVAAIRGDVAKVQQLIMEGADVNCVDYAGWTALHEACNRGFVSVAHELIHAGASVNAKGLDNETPLHDACINNHFKIVELLLGSGASTSIVNRRGQTPADVCRLPAILTLLQQASQHSVESNNRSCESPSKMSRRTPPNNRVESKMQEVKHEAKVEKEAKLDESGVVLGTSGQGILSTTAVLSSSSSSTSSSSSSTVCGGPSSPRVTLRLPPVPGRTADKMAGTSDAKSCDATGDDPYEFKCSKDEPGNQATTSSAAEVLEDNTEEDDQEKGDKRSAEEDDDTDQARKKKRKDDQKEQLASVSAPNKGSNRTPGDKSSKAAARGNIMNNHPNQLFTPAKSGCNNNINTSMNCSLSGSNGSPPSGEANNTLATNSNVCGSSNSNGAASSSVGAEVHRKSPLIGSSNSPKAAVKQEKCDEPSDDECCRSDSTGSGTGGPKVPPLKIVLSSCGGGSSSSSSTASQEQEQSGQQAGKSAGSRHLPYVVPASQGSETAAPKEDTAATNVDTSNKESNTFLSVKEEPLSPGGSSSGDKGAARITRSHRGTGNCSADEGTTIKAEVKPDDGEAKTIRVKTEVKEETAAPSTPSSSSSGPTPASSSIGSEAVHPRKRKINIKEEEPEPAQSPPSEQPLTNCYQMFLKIRRQIDDRRKLLYPVQPKPPQGFKDYLMNRGTYVLAGNPSSQRSVPIMSPPAALSQPLKDLFNEQEDDRYKLRLQHQIEREKLVLSVEQEILRVHGRAARALASQVLPFSACTMLRDQEVYNILTPEQEEKHRNARSRYNGRLFLSWLQDVDDKWEKIKESMVLRQQNEAESLNAVHRMNWECKMKELGLLDNKSRPVIEELHVPMVAVSDFDLLPA